MAPALTSAHMRILTHPPPLARVQTPPAARWWRWMAQARRCAPPYCGWTCAPRPRWVLQGGDDCKAISTAGLQRSVCMQCLLPNTLPSLVCPPAQAAKVAACGDEALAVNSAGAGPVSAEWMVPKVRLGQGAACEALHA